MNYLLEYYSTVMLKNYKGGFMYYKFYPVNNEQETSMKTFLVLGTIVAVAMIGITGSNGRLYAGGYGNDDDINWKKFKNSNTYEDANKKSQKCFERAHDRGDNLAGYEVEKCEDKPGSYD